MRKSLLCAAFLGIGLLAGGAAVSTAATEGGQMGHFGHGPLGRLIMAHVGRAMTLKAELNLTDAQRTAMRETILAHKQELATAIKPAVDAKRELRDAVLADKPDDATIKKAADDLGKKVGDAAVVVARVKVELASKANLTPEQLKKIADFRAANDASVDEFFKQIDSVK